MFSSASCQAHPESCAGSPCVTASLAASPEDVIGFQNVDISGAKSRLYDGLFAGRKAMKNVVLSMLAKISQIDASTKQLTARVEAQSLLISALVLAVSKQGGVTEMIEGANKAINTVIDSADSDEVLKSDAALLLSELQDLLIISRAVDSADEKINHEGLNELAGVSKPADQLPSDNN